MRQIISKIKVVFLLSYSVRLSIYIIYKAVISAGLFGCPIITQKPVNRFALNFYWGSLENNGNVLSLVLRF